NLENRIDSYFKTWSAGNLQAYKNHFHETAIIHYKSRYSGAFVKEELKQFINNQELAIKSSEKMREFPLSKKIVIQGDTADAIVRWKLVSQDREDTGYDHFIWVKTKNGWKILYLFFYFDK
ncbi:MAG: nuclear transport factor 2 family protein, partial [Leptospiraceae bacterium]|nr:nuclear transport factor 2 family protein [Leptospiraceae bacterium]